MPIEPGKHGGHIPVINNGIAVVILCQRLDLVLPNKEPMMPRTIWRPIWLPMLRAVLVTIASIGVCRVPRRVPVLLTFSSARVAAAYQQNRWFANIKLR